MIHTKKHKIIEVLTLDIQTPPTSIEFIVGAVGAETVIHSVVEMLREIEKTRSMVVKEEKPSSKRGRPRSTKTTTSTVR